MLYKIISAVSQMNAFGDNDVQSLNLQNAIYIYQ